MIYAMMWFDETAGCPVFEGYALTEEEAIEWESLDVSNFYEEIEPSDLPAGMYVA